MRCIAHYNMLALWVIASRSIGKWLVIGVKIIVEDARILVATHIDPNINDRVIEVIRQSEILDGISEQTIQELIRTKDIRQYLPGIVIFQDGDYLDHLYVLFSGRVKLIKQSTNGRDFTIDTLHAGDCLNPLTFFGDGYIWMSAETVEPTILLSYKREEFIHLATCDLTLLNRLIRAGTERMRTVCERLINIMSDKAEVRVFKLVLSLALTARYGKRIPFTHYELADMCGVTRETVTRAITTLNGIGIARSHRGYLEVIGIKELNRLVTESDV